MSKIKLTVTLTAEQILDAKEHYENWSDYSPGSLGAYLQSHPLTLEFEVPNLWRTDFENASVCLNNELNHLVIDLFGRVYQVDLHSDIRSFTHWMEIPEVPGV